LLTSAHLFVCSLLLFSFLSFFAFFQSINDAFRRAIRITIRIAICYPINQFAAINQLSTT
jgi:hypothetical protein